MSRLTAAWDRVTSLSVGVVLLAAGLALIGWATGLLDRWATGVPSQLSTARLTQTTATPWWPWAAGIGGVVLGLFALRWLAAHLPIHHSGPTTLAGSDTSGRLTTSLPDVAQTAATQLALAPGVRAARGRVHTDRGRRTVDLVVTCDTNADLPTLIRHAREVGAELATVLGRATPPTRVHLHTSRRRRTTRHLE